MVRSIGFDGGLEARVADPLWMLARQWQVLEFKGDDAAQPAGVRIAGQNIKLSALKGLDGDWTPLTQGSPLEVVVETTPAPDFGAAGMHAAVQAGRRLIRLLKAAKLEAVVSALRSEFPLKMPDKLVTFGGAGEQAAALFARWGIDAAGLAAADIRQIKEMLSNNLPPARVDDAVKIIESWRNWYRRRDGDTRCLAWDEERLEYKFSLRGGQSPQHIELAAPEHHGGRLDWYAFDLVSSPSKPVAPERVITAMPSPVRFRGMPASRWWQFEDGTVNFGDLEAGPADLARLLVAEFTTVYSDNWFVVPIPVLIGSLTQITRFEAIDNFGGRARIPSLAETDSQKGRVERPWRLFELSGDTLSQDHPSPWLFIAPALAGVLNGPVLERVLLARDEGANLAWAIERLVEGVLGRAVERSEAWHAAAPAQRPGQPRRAPVAQSYDAQYWRYELESPPPAWWIPLLPERIAVNSAQVRLRRARMQAWDLYTSEQQARQAGSQGAFLDPRRPVWINEEEVPRMGARVERRWQFGRWLDGSYHVWLQRSKAAGRGERSSALRWDALLPETAETAK